MEFTQTKNSHILIAFSILLLVVTSCKKNKECQYVLPPNILFFTIKKNGTEVEFSELNKIMMFYLNGGTRVYKYSSMSDDTTFVFPAARYSPNLEGSKVLANGYISENGRWFLEFPDGDIDTLDVSVHNLSCEEGIKDRCYCTAPFDNIKFNGENVYEDQNFQTTEKKIVFQFNK